MFGFIIENIKENKIELKLVTNLYNCYTREENKLNEFKKT